MTLLFFLKPAVLAGPLNLSATGGTATAAAGTTNLAFAWPAAIGTAAATGGTATVAIFGGLVAIGGQATATGGTDTLRYTYTAAGGQATAGGGAATPVYAQPAPGGKFVLKDVTLSVAGIDVSNRCSSLSLDFTTDELDITPLGSHQYRETMGTTKTAVLKMSLFADSPTVQPNLINTLKAGPVQVEVQPHTALTTITNPEWSGFCVATSITSLQGQVGEAATADIELHSTGDILQAPAVVDTFGGGIPYPATGLYPSGTLYPAS